jgi:hypothetical protein
MHLSTLTLELQLTDSPRFAVFLGKFLDEMQFFRVSVYARVQGCTEQQRLVLSVSSDVSPLVLIWDGKDCQLARDSL